MTEFDDRIVEEQPVRETWERPELRRLDAADAEVAGASGSDGVIGNS
jgi:hypothetical protein